MDSTWRRSSKLRPDEESMLNFFRNCWKTVWRIQDFLLPLVFFTLRCPSALCSRVLQYAWKAERNVWRKAVSSFVNFVRWVDWPGEGEGKRGGESDIKQVASVWGESMVTSIYIQTSADKGTTGISLITSRNGIRTDTNPWSTYPSIHVGWKNSAIQLDGFVRKVSRLPNRWMILPHSNHNLNFRGDIFDSWNVHGNLLGHDILYLDEIVDCTIEITNSDSLALRLYVNVECWMLSVENQNSSPFLSSSLTILLT